MSHRASLLSFFRWATVPSCFLPSNANENRYGSYSGLVAQQTVSRESWASSILCRAWSSKVSNWRGRQERKPVGKRRGTEVQGNELPKALRFCCCCLLWEVDQHFWGAREWSLGLVLIRQLFVLYFQNWWFGVFWNMPRNCYEFCTVKGKILKVSSF